MRNTLIFIAILIAGIAIFWSFTGSRTPEPTEIPISEVVTMSQQNLIRSIEIDGDTLSITETNGSVVKAIKEPNANIYEITGLKLDNVAVSVKNNTGLDWGTILINFLPLVLIGGCSSSCSARLEAPIIRLCASVEAVPVYSRLINPPSPLKM
jgi:cell division protease FtsH